MSKFTRRVATIAACLAVIGAVDTTALRVQADLGRALITTGYASPRSTPAVLSGGRAAASLAASTRQQRHVGPQPAAALSASAGTRVDRSVPVGFSSGGAYRQAPEYSRGERGPPSYVRS